MCVSSTPTLLRLHSPLDVRIDVCCIYRLGLSACRRRRIPTGTRASLSLSLSLVPHILMSVSVPVYYLQSPCFFYPTVYPHLWWDSVDVWF